MSEQCGFFLSAGDGKAKRLSVEPPEGSGKRRVPENLCDLAMGQRLGVNGMHVIWMLLGRNQLHGADAIATDGCEKVECGSARRTITITQATKYAVVIGQ